MLLFLVDYLQLLSRFMSFVILFDTVSHKSILGKFRNM